MLRLNELRMDWRAAVAVVATTLLLAVRRYYGLSFHALLSSTVLYLIVPLFIILLLYRESPAKYGVTFGDWRAGILLTGLGCAFVAVAVFFVARSPDFQGYYRYASVSGRIPFWLADGIDLVAWEFFFRGFLLFALYRACGPIALVLQAVPFTMAHFGKPALETFSCIFGGTVFGYIAWRTRSFLYPFLIHWFQASFLAVVVSGVLM
jgi:membrane protease YdiL (CAAX protease family)